MKIFALPIPLLVAVAFQVPEGLVDGTSGIVTTLLLGVWVFGWMLDKVGKFPGAKSNGASSAEALVATLMQLKVGERDKSLTDVVEVVTREDKDKPGWPMVWSSAEESREIRTLLKAIAEQQKDTNRLLEILNERRGEARD